MKRFQTSTATPNHALRTVSVHIPSSARRRRTLLARTTLFICCLLLPITPLRSAAPPIIASSTVTRGTLTFGSDAISFKTTRQEERFQFAPKRFHDGLTIPGLRVLDFTNREIGSPTGASSKPASVLTFQCEDGSKLALTVNQSVEVLRIELIFSDRTKAILWKLASDIQ